MIHIGIAATCRPDGFLLIFLRLWDGVGDGRGEEDIWRKGVKKCKWKKKTSKEKKLDRKVYLRNKFMVTSRRKVAEKSKIVRKY